MPTVKVYSFKDGSYHHVRDEEVDDNMVLKLSRYSENRQPITEFYKYSLKDKNKNVDIFCLTADLVAYINDTQK